MNLDIIFNENRCRGVDVRKTLYDESDHFYGMKKINRIHIKPPDLDSLPVFGELTPLLGRSSRLLSADK